MAKTEKDAGGKGAATGRPEARLPKGMRDIGAAELRQQRDMLDRIRAVYERYGFEPLETPAFEYTDALGKFLPDQDRPNEGVFSFQDEDEQWLSLRYDLTAPLARYVAENFQSLPKPFRRYAVGPVWRNEKPGPGRFRQFMQFDADTVGTDSVAADAEMCMLAADTLEAIGIKRGDYVIKVNSRKVLDGLLEIAGIPGDDQTVRQQVLRALDKLDRLGRLAVEELLGQGRKDESGDFTKGAGLRPPQIQTLIKFVYGGTTHWTPLKEMKERNQLPSEDEEVDQFENVRDVTAMLGSWKEQMIASPMGLEGVAELQRMQALWWGSDFGSKRLRIDASVVRGLEYYTGPVFEAELTFAVKDDEGRLVRFGSVGGGGRYDNLVSRFIPEFVPATGFSIGVSRLQAALAALNKNAAEKSDGPVVVLVMEKDRIAETQKLVQTLRNAGIRAEMYLGSSGMKAQMKYADKRNSPCVVIQGGDERAKNPPEVTLKDLVEGAKAAAAIKDNREWKEARPAQVSVREADLVSEVRKILARHA